MRLLLVRPLSVLWGRRRRHSAEAVLFPSRGGRLAGELMPFLSGRSLDALVEIISGGSAAGSTPAIGLYRKGWEIQNFMRSCGYDDFTVTTSRVQSLHEYLTQINASDGAQAGLTTVIESACDPRDFPNDTERHGKVVAYLNGMLRHDGLEVQQKQWKGKLVVFGDRNPVLETLAGTAQKLDLDTVLRDIERARDSLQADPEDAVTAACSTLESLFKSILNELGESLPSHKDISGLYAALKGPMGLDFGKMDLDPAIEEDVRRILYNGPRILDRDLSYVA